MNEIQHLTVKITPKKPCADPEEALMNLLSKIQLNEDLNLKDFNIIQADGVSEGVSHSDIVKEIYKDGITDFLDAYGNGINEFLVVSGTSQDKVVATLQKYLSKVGVDDELVIVDPYFYARPSNPNYIDLLTSLLSPHMAVVSKLVIVTTDNTRNIRAEVVTDVDDALKALKPSLSIVHHRTSEFHDRFIISNARKHGMVVGTSLNSIGHKYALVDKLKMADVTEIVKALNSLGFL